MKRKNLFIAATLLLLKGSFGQTIPQNFAGQNAWYTVYTDDGQPPANHDAFIHYINKVKASGAKFCRIGGANANILGNNPNNPTPITHDQVLFLVKRIRQAGMEPIVTAPYANPGNNNSNLGVAANNAKDLVTFINITNVGSIPGGKVTHWIIANEPDLHLDGNGHKIGYNYNENNPASCTEIRKYIKQFAIEMRKADPSIKIIGPEFAGLWPHMFLGGTYGGNTFDGLLNGATNDISGLIESTDQLGNPVPSNLQSLPYIDYVSFHYYGSADTEFKVINNIFIPNDNFKINKFLDDLKSACTSSPMATKRGNIPLKIAITEANLKARKNTDYITETGPESHLRGQWWCDFMGLCLSKGVEFINFWSSAEGSSAIADDNFGFIRSTISTEKLRPNYHHFKMFADNFKGQFLPSSINQISSNFKAFGYLDNTDQNSANHTIGVMILNQNKTGANNIFGHSFSIHLGSGTPNAKDIQVSVAGGINIA